MTGSSKAAQAREMLAQGWDVETAAEAVGWSPSRVRAAAERSDKRGPAARGLTARVAVSLSTEDKARLDELAETRGVSVSELVRGWIRRAR